MSERRLVTPPVNATGIFIVSQPYTLREKTTYRCHAIRTIDELAKKNIDVYGQYYKPVGISTSIYEEDTDKGASIVTLISSDNKYVYIPNTYIESYPGMSGIRYERKLVLVDMGPLPNTMDIEYIVDDVASMVKKAAGVGDEMVNVELATVPMDGTLTHEEHVELEASRRAAINNHTPLAEQVTLLEKENAQLREDYELLLSVFEDNKDVLEAKK